MPRKLPSTQRRRAAPAPRQRPKHNRTRGTPRRPSPRLFNLGLPRTGTTWFSAVASHFGLRALHCNEPSGCLGLKRERLLAAFDGASRDPRVLSRMVAAVDAFSDVPWFAASPALLRRLAPRGAEFFVTTRSVGAWFHSFREAILQENQNQSCADDPLLRYAKTLSQRGGPLSRLCTERLRPALRRRAWEQLFFEHHSRVLAEFSPVTVLDLTTRASAETAVRAVAQRIGAPIDARTASELAQPRNARLVENGRVIRGVQRSWSRHDF